MGPASSTYGKSGFLVNSKSYGNHTPVSHVLICWLDLKFDRILLGIPLSNYSGGTCNPPISGWMRTLRISEIRRHWCQNQNETIEWRVLWLDRIVSACVFTWRSFGQSMLSLSDRRDWPGNSRTIGLFGLFFLFPVRWHQVQAEIDSVTKTKKSTCRRLFRRDPEWAQRLNCVVSVHWCV